MRKKLVSITFFKKTIYLVLFMILAVAMQTIMAFSPLATGVTVKNSGLISFSQSQSLARPLHVEGNKIKNDLGEITYLRGWQKGAGVETNAPMWGGTWNYYSQTHVDTVLAKMASYGSNLVREHITASGWLGNVNVSTDSGTMTYREVLDDLLTRCEANGIYLILDFYGIYSKDCPVHGWNGCTYQDVFCFDPYTTDGHEGVVPNQTAFVSLISSMVEVLGDAENLIIEPQNEAFYGYAGTFYTNLWQDIYQDCITAIRAEEDAHGYVHHLIICQFGANTVTWDYTSAWTNFNWYWSNPLTDTAGNLIYSVHLYRFHGSVGDQQPKESRPYAYADIKPIYQNQRIDDVAAEVPVIIGEIGAHRFTDSNSGEYLWMQNTLQILNEWNLSYIGFSWWDAGTQWDELTSGTEATTGGTVNKYGQLLVDAIKQGWG